MLYFCHRNWFAIPPICTFRRWSGGFLLSPTKVQNFYQITNQLVIKFLNVWRHSLDYAFVFSPRNSAKIRIVDKIKEDCIFPEYTYVDTAEVTLQHNPNIPHNRAMHTFLVDNYGKVVIVGSPIYNNRVKQLFQKIIGQRNKIIWISYNFSDQGGITHSSLGRTNWQILKYHF